MNIDGKTGEEVYRLFNIAAKVVKRKEPDSLVGWRHIRKMFTGSGLYQHYEYWYSDLKEGNYTHCTEFRLRVNSTSFKQFIYKCRECIPFGVLDTWNLGKLVIYVDHNAGEEAAISKEITVLASANNIDIIECITIF